MTERAAKRHPDRHPQGVVVAWMHPGDVAGDFCQSLMLTLLHDSQHHRRILGKGGFISLATGPRIASGRTRVVREFLAFPGAPEWLWMLDADMTFGPDTLDRLLDVAHPTQRPIVGGLCFAGGRGVEPFPTLYVMKDGPDGSEIEHLTDWPRDQVVEVDATGAACLLVHRSVFESMATRYPAPYPWFAESFLSGAEIGEDVTFAFRARQIGFPVTVHTGVHIGHVKSVNFDLAHYDAQREQASGADD